MGRVPRAAALSGHPPGFANPSQLRGVRAGALGAAPLTGPWIERRANALTAVTLLLIGALVVVGVI